MSFPVRAITLDLDDTLWPFAPIGVRIEEGLHDFFLEHSPATAERFPIPGMRELRTLVHADNPHLIHDLSALRRLTIERALRETGGDPALADAAHALFQRERNRVDFYPDALQGLQRIAARLPVVAVSNGNADLAAIGIDALFAGQLSALMHGKAKPDASLFHAACASVGIAPHEVLHVGDDIALDVLGAARAGLRTCWMHRDDAHVRDWPHGDMHPDLRFDTLTALADWLDAGEATSTSPDDGRRMTTQDAFTTASEHARPLHLVQRTGLDDWRKAQLPAIGTWLDAQTFTATSGSLVLLPGDEGIGGAVLGVADPLDPFAYAHAPYALPPGDWRIEGALDDAARRALQLGWGLGAYRFTRYKAPTRAPARLVLDAMDAETADMLEACLRVRDMVNTPTEHMGPQDLESIAREIAQQQGARIEVFEGEVLLEHNFPAIHAVGRASHRAPRLIELQWGEESNPHLTLVGKGVCFDTGGLDIKAAAGMRNMKKDMGGAAHAIALAGLVMAQKLPVRLTLLVPAVENAIGPESYRPGEVIATRKGVSVEIDNTDAEGRIVLCDALTYAGESEPDLILDFATLTGAARIALGPDLPALFSNDDGVANDWLAAGERTRDPLWRMPLWQPYVRYLTSTIADIANASNSTMAGCITAAIYLQRFIPREQKWAHLDVYSWNDNDRPGKPPGGEAQALRAAFDMLKARYGSGSAA